MGRRYDSATAGHYFIIRHHQELFLFSLLWGFLIRIEVSPRWRLLVWKWLISRPTSLSAPNDVLGPIFDQIWSYFDQFWCRYAARRKVRESRFTTGHTPWLRDPGRKPWHHEGDFGVKMININNDYKLALQRIVRHTGRGKIENLFNFE